MLLRGRQYQLSARESAIGDGPADRNWYCGCQLVVLLEAGGVIRWFCGGVCQYRCLVLLRPLDLAVRRIRLSCRPAMTLGHNPRHRYYHDAHAESVLRYLTDDFDASVAE